MTEYIIRKKSFLGFELIVMFLTGMLVTYIVAAIIYIFKAKPKEKDAFQKLYNPWFRNQGIKSNITSVKGGNAK